MIEVHEFADIGSDGSEFVINIWSKRDAPMCIGSGLSLEAAIIEAKTALQAYLDYLESRLNAERERLKAKA